MDDLTSQLESLEKENLISGVNATRKTIILGADHAGFELKEQIKKFLKSSGYVVEDEGSFVLTEGDDYPEICKIVAKRVSAEPSVYQGILFGGSGQGEAITANRLPGVRAVVYYGGDEDIIKLSRDHNNANILSLGSRFLNLEQAQKMITLWLTTPFSGDERHIRRLQKIDGQIEEENIF
ncbi:MAG: ribose 5-phosphate isomerase [Patescibacteria group bacterium]|nr:ribose 5-phosphate isomerase [Patescibacteria group bacterium]